MSHPVRVSLFGLVLLGALLHAPHVSAQTPLSQAERALARGEYETAARALSEVPSLPRSGPAERARRRMVLAQVAEADAFRLALELGPRALDVQQQASEAVLAYLGVLRDLEALSRAERPFTPDEVNVRLDAFLGALARGEGQPAPGLRDLLAVLPLSEQPGLCAFTTGVPRICTELGVFGDVAGDHHVLTEVRWGGAAEQAMLYVFHRLAGRWFSTLVDAREASLFRQERQTSFVAGTLLLELATAEVDVEWCDAVRYDRRSAIACELDGGVPRCVELRELPLETRVGLGQFVRDEVGEVDLDEAASCGLDRTAVEATPPLESLAIPAGGFAVEVLDDGSLAMAGPALHPALSTPRSLRELECMVARCVPALVAD